MRFLIVDTDYPAFLEWLYTDGGAEPQQSYAQQLQVREQSFFGCGLSYANNLQRLGHEAHQVFFNNEHLQDAWAREHGLQIKPTWQFRMRRGFVPWVSHSRHADWLYSVLTAQIEHYRPDVLINNAMTLSSAYFKEVKPRVRLLVGTHGSALPENWDFGAYDVVLSVVENFVDYFRRRGLRSELLRLAFEPLVLNRFGDVAPSIPVSFVGQLSHHHTSRLNWLEHLCARAPVEVWAPSTGGLPAQSSVRRCHRGAAWGVEMYDVLHQSRITLNHHIDVAGQYAGNSRLFEATGVGTLLLTDDKRNLHHLFDVGKEVIAYKSAEECGELVEYYLQHEDERQAIAKAGQQRTLTQHTYYHRMQELAEIVKRYMRRCRASRRSMSVALTGAIQ